VKALPRNTVLVGDAAEVLAALLPESVDCIVTSPPYFGLRDYGVAGQRGREQHVAAWVARLRDIFHGLARVLKPTGSVWLNVGDAYSRHRKTGTPPKGLYAAPERLLLALLADGWVVRNKVVWAKPNPLPQSATDRLSPTYEVVYFLTRGRRYFFDLDAIRVPHRSRRGKPDRSAVGRLYQGGNDGLSALKAAGRVGHRNGKNPGDVWTIPTAAYRGEHFATFPEALIERPILTTCPQRICVQCDRAWTRPVRVLTLHPNEGARTVRKVGELERCDCFAPSRRGVVLDPFFGTGTVGVVAERLGRDWLGIELNPAYAALAKARISGRRAA
jgi:site-specific DNA-methyltransferase (adenine-specific)